MIAAHSSLAELAQSSKAWPFEEARKVVKRLEKADPAREAVFETGYGPSGLPHIGTFGEVARTSMVRHALEVMKPGVKTRLVCFSDDMDGLRKVPTECAEPGAARRRARKAADVRARSVRHASKLRRAQQCAAAQLSRQLRLRIRVPVCDRMLSLGAVRRTLLRMLECYDAVMDIILPTLGPDRRATYSPFLPVSPTSGKVLQVPIVERDLKAGTVVYRDPDTQKLVETPVTGGHVKCQWKADWAMRWTALGVDYEMAGKDLIDSVTLSSKICRVLGGSRQRASITSCSSTTRRRRFRSRRATASRWRNGWPTPRRRASLFICSRSPRRRSGFIST